ncbi:hypothetical protein [Glacieibacterium frigidum]|uniref:Uncharacterized protein n=1 Tax=Glacieibacterium frigidum TaxID=2593303 RepID=A0A552UEZ3_9SPHN|nr:hypothetical protein [Glacieibacterium frigidum]TRW16796.1 hypothetical protein FMM06_00885 [Glacieibacterium frigidum]
MITAADHIRRETLISIAINGVLSLVFTAIFFAPFADIAVPGLAFDFVPQSFAITLMSVLVPGFLTRRKLSAGGVAPLGGRSVLPRSFVLRALLLAVIAAGVGYVLGLAFDAVVGVPTLAWGTGAAIKIAYGVLLAAVVTPIGLRAELRRTAR